MKIKNIITIVFCTLFIVCIGSCKNNSITNEAPIGFFIGNSQCKNNPTLTPTSQAVHSSNIDCLQYQYDGSRILTIKHINAAFNCCPQKISASIDITSNTITIIENEAASQCSCLCLFDLELRIENLPRGSYYIHVIEPYVNSGDAVMGFNVSLNTQVNDQFCIERNQYPWGLGN